MGSLQHGRYDPTTRVGDTTVWRAVRTPEGGATARFTGGGHEVCVDAWGDGAAWVTEHAPEMVGAADDAEGFAPRDRFVSELHRRHPGMRIAISLRLPAAGRDDPRAASDEHPGRPVMGLDHTPLQRARTRPGEPLAAARTLSHRIAPLPPLPPERNRARPRRHDPAMCVCSERLRSPRRRPRTAGDAAALRVRCGCMDDGAGTGQLRLAIPTRYRSAIFTCPASSASPSPATRREATTGCSSCSSLTADIEDGSCACSSPAASPHLGTRPTPASWRSNTSDTPAPTADLGPRLMIGGTMPRPIRQSRRAHTPGPVRATSLCC